MKRSLSYLIIFFFALNATTLLAQIELPSFISNNMVLQQQVEAPIWGKAKPVSTVHIECGWFNSYKLGRFWCSSLGKGRDSEIR